MLNMLVAWAAIVGGVGFIFEYVEKTIEREVKQDISQSLRIFSNKSVTEIIADTNRYFIRLFDRVYAKEISRADDVLWALILTSTFMGISIYPLSKLFGLAPLPIEGVLILGLCGGIFVGSHVLADSKRFRTKARKIAWEVCVAFPTISVVFILVMLYQSGFSKLETGQVVLLCVLLMFFTALTGIIMSDLRRYLNISPKRAILSSLFAIVVMALFTKNNIHSLLMEFDNRGLLIISFILLNIYGDALSLLETGAVLRYAGKGSIGRFLLLLILDILLTAGIFLAIPLAAGGIHDFIPAIIFKGSRPWLGILFWSTFFTSILFYLYLMSSILLMILQLLSGVFLNLQKFIPIETRPFRCLGLVAIIIVTFTFAVVAVI